VLHPRLGPVRQRCHSADGFRGRIPTHRASRRASVVEEEAVADGQAGCVGKDEAIGYSRPRFARRAVGGRLGAATGAAQRSVRMVMRPADQAVSAVMSSR